MSELAAGKATCGILRQWVEKDLSLACCSQLLGESQGNPTHIPYSTVSMAPRVIVASKGGSETQPQWYFNLLANPVITVQVKAEKFSARAILAEGATRDRLWKLMTEVHPAYLDYQAKTSRELPVFSLEKVSE